MSVSVGDRDSDLKGSNVVLLHSHRRNLCDHTVESLIFEGLDLNPRGLAKIDPANVTLVHFALNINLASITECHHQGRARAEHQNRADRVAHLYVTGENNPINGRDNVGIAELFLKLLQTGFVLRDLSLRLGDLGLKNCHLRPCDALLIRRHLVFFFGIVERRNRDHAVLLHLQRAVVRTL